MKAPLNVILVDDEDDIRTVGRLALATVGGWDVRCASSGPQALELIEQSRPDLLILDVMMPQLDGPSTLAALRKRPGGGDVPVVFMTAKVQPREIQEYLEHGAIGVITKPFDPMTLATQIDALLDAHLRTLAATR